MSSVVGYGLIMHVLLSVVGLIASYAIVMFLLQRTLNLNHLKVASIIGFISYFLSSLTGLYFFSAHYLPVLQEAMRGGSYAWAEAFVLVKGGLLTLVTLTMLFMVFKIVRKQDELTAGSPRHKFLIQFGSYTLAASILMVLAGVIVAGAGK